MPTIRVGLTGMSRAGKTVFLTSLVHNFTELGGKNLAEFEYAGWQYVGHPVPPAADGFPYARNLDRFRRSLPAWPDPTHRVTGIGLALHFAGGTGGKIKRRPCTLEFVDYPGERLADVVLLDRPYAAWAADAWDGLAGADPAAPFRECVGRLAAGPDAAPDEAFDAARRLYGEHARAAWAGGRPVAPVHPVLAAAPGEKVDAPFFPLPAAALASRPKLAKRLRKAYDRYVATDVRPLFDRIAACHHQVVLVDVLDVLRYGPARHREVQGQFNRVVHLLRLLQPGWVGRHLLGRASLRHVTFCATKADQATRDGRPNLAHLLRMMVARAAAAVQIDLGVVSPRYEVVSAHRCTEDLPADHDGRQFLALKGRLRGADADQLIYPGPVPEQWPVRADEWSRFKFPDFAPREMPVVATGLPLPHLGMDRVMYRLVEEVLT